MAFCPICFEYQRDGKDVYRHRREAHSCGHRCVLCDKVIETPIRDHLADVHAINTKGTVMCGCCHCIFSDKRGVNLHKKIVKRVANPGPTERFGVMTDKLIAEMKPKLLATRYKPNSLCQDENWTFRKNKFGLYYARKLIEECKKGEPNDGEVRFSELALRYHFREADKGRDYEELTQRRIRLLRKAFVEGVDVDEEHVGVLEEMRDRSEMLAEYITVLLEEIANPGAVKREAPKVTRKRTSDELELAEQPVPKWSRPDVTPPMAADQTMMMMVPMQDHQAPAQVVRMPIRGNNHNNNQMMLHPVMARAHAEHLARQALVHPMAPARARAQGQGQGPAPAPAQVMRMPMQGNNAMVYNALTWAHAHAQTHHWTSSAPMAPAPPTAQIALMPPSQGHQVINTIAQAHGHQVLHPMVAPGTPMQSNEHNHQMMLIQMARAHALHLARQALVQQLQGNHAQMLTTMMAPQAPMAPAPHQSTQMLRQMMMARALPMAPGSQQGQMGQNQL